MSISDGLIRMMKPLLWRYLIMARHADLRHAQFLCLPAMHWPLLRGSVASSRHKWPRHRYSYDASNVQALGTLKASYSAHRRVVQWYMHCSGRCLRRGGMSYAVCIQELCADDFVDKMPEDEKLWIVVFRAILPELVV